MSTFKKHPVSQIQTLVLSIFEGSVWNGPNAHLSYFIDIVLLFLKSTADNLSILPLYIYA